MLRILFALLCFGAFEHQKCRGYTFGAEDWKKRVSFRPRRDYSNHNGNLFPTNQNVRTQSVFRPTIYQNPTTYNQNSRRNSLGTNCHWSNLCGVSGNLNSFGTGIPNAKTKGAINFLQTSSETNRAQSWRLSFSNTQDSISQNKGDNGQSSSKKGYLESLSKSSNNQSSFVSRFNGNTFQKLGLPNIGSPQTLKKKTLETNSNKPVNTFKNYLQSSKATSNRSFSNFKSNSTLKRIPNILPSKIFSAPQYLPPSSSQTTSKYVLTTTRKPSTTRHPFTRPYFKITTKTNNPDTTMTTKRTYFTTSTTTPSTIRTTSSASTTTPSTRSTTPSRISTTPSTRSTTPFTTTANPSINTTTLATTISIPSMTRRTTSVITTTPSMTMTASSNRRPSTRPYFTITTNRPYSTVTTERTYFTTSKSFTSANNGPPAMAIIVPREDSSELDEFPTITTKKLTTESSATPRVTTTITTPLATTAPSTKTISAFTTTATASINTTIPAPTITAQSLTASTPSATTTTPSMTMTTSSNRRPSTRSYFTITTNRPHTTVARTYFSENFTSANHGPPAMAVIVPREDSSELDEFLTTTTKKLTATSITPRATTSAASITPTTTNSDQLTNTTASSAKTATVSINKTSLATTTAAPSITMITPSITTTIPLSTLSTTTPSTMTPDYNRFLEEATSVTSRTTYRATVYSRESTMTIKPAFRGPMYLPPQPKIRVRRSTNRTLQLADLTGTPRPVWYAGIYRKTKRPYEPTCGASIIREDIVISAAHCFWDDISGLQAADRFAVAARKIYKPWNDPMDKRAQKSDVLEIKIPPRFLGAKTSFQSDLAILKLATPFTYNRGLRPICVDFDDDFDRQQMRAGHLGTVAGWGYTDADGTLAVRLLWLELPYVEIEKCISDSEPDFLKYITCDKVCAGENHTGKALCRGDSGGGLAFWQGDPGHATPYLRGVASTAPRANSACNVFAYASFTHLHAHRTFLRDHVPDVENCRFWG